MPSKAKTIHHRDKIRASVLLGRLDKHAMGEIEMTNSQVRAAEILLKKAVPDLSAVTVAGDPDNPLKADVRIHIIPGRARP